VSQTFAPTSGSAVFNGLQIANTINQTGGASGVTRSIFINPTLTAAADYRAIETVVGNVILGSTSGNVGINDISPDARLDVVNSVASQPILRLEHAATPTVDYIQVDATGGTTGAIFRITSAGDQVIGGKLTSTATDDLGWKVQNATNQACNTTCTTGACVIGIDAVTTQFLACTDATADSCLCAG